MRSLFGALFPCTAVLLFMLLDNGAASATSAASISPTDLDFRAAYCLGASIATRDRVQSQLQAKPEAEKTEADKTEGPKILQSLVQLIEHFQLLLARGYFDLSNDDQLTHLLIPLHRGNLMRKP